MTNVGWLLEGCEIADLLRVLDCTDAEVHFRPEYKKLRCPVCGDSYQHSKTAQEVPGKDSYEAGWGGRGSLMLLPFSGECGHRWDLCFGFHKGETFAFVRVPPNATRTPDREGAA